MFSIFLFLLFSSSVNTQYYYQYNSYNPWSSNIPNYPGWNQGISQTQVGVRGTLLSDDITPLPFGSQIIVSLSDVSMQDTASRPLNTVILSGSYRFPISFYISYSMAQVQANGNAIRQYAIQARIEKDGQLLYINDQYTPVQLIPPPINPVNVYMKKVSNYPGNGGGGGGLYTTRPSVADSMFICQQIPDVGPCRGYFEQFYFNVQLRSCQMFIWGGCGGNVNRFNTRDECERTCSFYRRRLSRNNAKQRWFG